MEKLSIIDITYFRFPKIRNGIVIRPLVVPKICHFSHINSWQNLLYIFRKIQTVMRMKVDRNKGICPDFYRTVLDGYIDDNDELPLGYPDTNLLTRHLQELPCLRLVLLCLEFITRLIESACPSPLLPNLNSPLKHFRGPR